MNVDKKKLKELISKDDVEKALEILIEKCRSVEELNEIILLSNRLNSLKIRERKAIISFNEFNLEKNRIVDSLVSIIDTGVRRIDSDSLNDDYELLLIGLKKCHLNINVIGNNAVEQALLDLALVFDDKKYNLLHHLLIFRDIIFDGGSIPGNPVNEYEKMIQDSFFLLRDFGLVKLEYDEFIEEEGIIKIYKVDFNDLGKKFISDFLKKNINKIDLINNELEKIKTYRLEKK